MGSIEAFAHTQGPVELKQVEQSACPTGEHNYKPRWSLPECEQGKCARGEGKVLGGGDGAGEDGIVEGGEEYADDCGVDPRDGGPGAGIGSEAVPEWEDTEYQQEGREEDAPQGQQSPGPAGRENAGNGAQVSGEGEQGPRDGLCSTISGKEVVLRYQIGRDYFRFEEGKDNVASAKYEGAGAVKTVGEGEGVVVDQFTCDWKGQQESKEEDECNCCTRYATRFVGGWGGGDVPRPEKGETQNCTPCNYGKLEDCSVGEKEYGGCDYGNGDRWFIRREGLAHAPKREGYDRYGHYFQAMNPLGCFTPEGVDAVGKEDEGNCGGQCEPEPRGQSADVTGPTHSYGNPKLAAGGAREELAKAHKLGEALFGEPLASGDVLVAEVADVGNGPAEGREAQAKGDEEDFDGAGHGPRGVRSVRNWRDYNTALL